MELNISSQQNMGSPDSRELSLRNVISPNPEKHSGSADEEILNFNKRQILTSKLLRSDSKHDDSFGEHVPTDVCSKSRIVENKSQIENSS